MSQIDPTYFFRPKPSFDQLISETYSLQLIPGNSMFNLQRDGVLVIPSVLSPAEITDWLTQLESNFAADLAAIKDRRGAVYAARNILDSLPKVCSIWNHEAIRELLTETLGNDFGLVRGLYFDKHPDRTWSLPWHKDMTIAVKANSLTDDSLTSHELTKPTCKSGVPHVEAPESVLQNMLTLRIHLDEVTEDNGPLEVSLGSHHHGKRSTETHDVKKILVQAGDVLAMRPLVSHASGSSTPGTHRHRRILHLEFAADRNLPDGFDWYDFRTAHQG